VNDMHDMPGHLARRFQQIAVAVFLAEMEKEGHDLTPVQFAALAAIGSNPAIDQVTLAGLIAYDRTTITGVVDRLVQKGLVARQESSRDRRARELKITDAGRRTLGGATPARRRSGLWFAASRKRKPRSWCAFCRRRSPPATNSAALRCATRRPHRARRLPLHPPAGGNMMSGLGNPPQLG